MCICVWCIRGMDTSKRELFRVAKLFIFVHGWEFILRESVYYGKKELFNLIPFLCPVWNIAADYFRPITFSVLGTEVMAEKILSIGQLWPRLVNGAGASLTSTTIMPRSLHPCFRHHEQIQKWRGNFFFLNCHFSHKLKKLSGREAILGLWDCQLLNQRLKR